MAFRKSFAAVGISLYLLAASAGTVQHSKKSFRVHVRFLATSTTVRGSWYPNQDVYLVEITGAHGDSSLLARLIDQFPPYQAALPIQALSSGKDMLLRLRRDPACDVAFSKMPLRTAPGDPLALLPEPLGFRPDLSQFGAIPDVLPCYRTSRRE